MKAFTLVGVALALIGGLFYMIWTIIIWAGIGTAIAVVWILLTEYWRSPPNKD